ncbi:DMT family transporter [Rickettsiales endosymbiont of Paramecium tredecaurelia]|uniref:DMT family transporter n=1 Tax=Candidatus Sarmatiella mevalonica TaxID=2770581 RepID=UPI0019222C0E|nr:DMT family transporter [Candidatus Sarmatiella mevalonica]MBL3285249.1 DMT family transporter [Candidatus Sarmatiella mevalonica]
MNTKLQSYIIGVLWFLLSLISSNLNDVISKYVGNNLHSGQVAFLRFFFSTVTLIPFILHSGLEAARTSHVCIHIIRGVLLFFGIGLWIYGVNLVPLTTATVVSFSVPLFTLILAKFFLTEKVIWQRWVATIVGLVGVVITLNPNSNDFSFNAAIFVVASIAFASLDIINKIFVIKESMLSMLLYSDIVTTILSLPIALYFWKEPSTQQVVLLFVLGFSANAILFFLLKAFSMTDATALAPYRYFELIVSSAFSFCIWHELPSLSTFYGSLIIIPSTLFVILSEKKRYEQN